MILSKVLFNSPLGILKWQMEKIPHRQNIYKIKLEYEILLKVTVKVLTLTPESGIT